MSRASLPLLLLVTLSAACGSVKKGDGSDADGGGGGDPCEPGEALRCDGDDLVVCGEDGMTRETVACEISCDADQLACTCEPNTTSCADGVESVCDDSGLATIRQCALGCFEDARCGELDATNRLTQFFDEAATGPDLVLTDGSIVDTTDGEIIIDGLPITITSVELEAPTDEGGIPVRVFPVASLTVTGEVETRGGPALAFVSDGDVQIGGIVLVKSGNGIDGRGEGGGFVTCGSGMATIGGQGGGGFGGRGAMGGAVNGGASGGGGGAIVGNPEIIPLRGGGTNASVQPAGGAIQLVSRTLIEIEGGGAITAPGNGGSDNNSGGGAGGAIVLEAPVVTLTGATSALAANGGGGGCGNSGTVLQSSEGGRLDTTRARGCTADGGGDGGLGGAGDNPNGTIGETIDGCGVAAGAGGGGVGRIRISTADGSFAPADGAIVSPPFTAMTVGIR